MTSNLVEKLAALEHFQWAQWTKYMLANLTPENIARWKKQCETSYNMLSEEDKEKDRKWAYRAIDIFVDPSTDDDSYQLIKEDETK
jgi:hypothetical protein